jgi:pseudouridine-5'-phosphate glycosidase
MTPPIAYGDAVQHARSTEEPVVALESTLITHGLPYPQNVETALAMEQAVRDAGATPATIAILKGRITVGLSADAIDELAQAETVRKCSRRDIALAVGLKEHGATTVAGTMLIAHMAGIDVFATGGIGGVHRGQPFDVSADLQELGRTPVAVVCSGAKSILDLPLTMEVLETQGVPVIGLKTDTLPAFYTRSSGIPLDARIESPAEAAAVIRAARSLTMQHGLLITVPVPEADALPADIAEAAIQQATAEADAQQIYGKALTPFVLSRVAQLTDGRAMKSNRALLVNNARVAADIAGHLAGT